jgi:hypothetical protein
MNDRDFLVVPVVALLFFVFCISYMTGFNAGEPNGRSGAIIQCVEKPQECKIEYDYLKLKANQK